jgi:thiamine pyrophosphate-dependent acetolactate synthase large subunit-like protein
MNIADYVLAFLASLGVRHLYGYPGSPLVPFLAAMERQDRIGWVLMRHENAAAMAAGAHARLTGELGVCVATSGPGALNAICGVVDADLDRAPVLAITGLVPTSQMGHWEFQDVDQTGLFGSVLEHSATCTHPNQLVALFRNFVGMAIQESRAVHLALPADLLETEIAPGDPLFDLDPDMLPQPLRLMPPPPAAIDLVASELSKYRLPVIVIGRRAVGCGPAIERLAEKLGAPVITSLDGKGIVDESHPNVLGVLGIFGYPAVTATQEILAEADVIVAIGVDTIKPFLTADADMQHRALIQCESDFGFLTHEYHRHRTLVGPLDAIADGLRDAVAARMPNPVIGRLAAERADNARGAEPAAANANADAPPYLHPRYLLAPLGRRLPAEAVVVLDTGAHTLWAAQYLQLTRRQRVITSSHLGTMGFSLPAAIAAQQANPDGPVIAICGDGGFGMVAGELGAATQAELPLVLVVFNNGVLQNVRSQQARPYGTRILNPDFVALAAAYGIDAARADAHADIAAILDQALDPARRRPMLIDLPIDPQLVFPISKWQHYAPPALRARH